MASTSQTPIYALPLSLIESLNDTFYELTDYIQACNEENIELAVELLLVYDSLAEFLHAFSLCPYEPQELEEEFINDSLGIEAEKERERIEEAEAEEYRKSQK